MSYYSRLIVCACIFVTPCVHAVDLYVEGLYWRASETVDWALSNNLSTTNQVISYKTISFDFDPGFRAGIGFKNSWDTDLVYTRFHTSASSSATGNLTSAFMGGKFAQGSTFYRSGQVTFTLDFNTLDLDLSKQFNVSQNIKMRPVIGLRGAWINQHIDNNFQGTVTVNELVKNDFRGVGPKAAIETYWIFYNKNNYQYSVLANFTTSYLWGDWSISDVVYNGTATQHTNVGSRNLGAVAIQGIIGVNLEYKRFAIKLGYEISDWLNQYQVLDDATGAHNNDLILQGITLGLTFKF